MLKSLLMAKILLKLHQRTLTTKCELLLNLSYGDFIQLHRCTILRLMKITYRPLCFCSTIHAVYMPPCISDELV